MTTTGKQIKALALLSSGMDSALAIRLVLDQGVEVVAVNFVIPFRNEKQDYESSLASQLGVSLTKVETGDDYLDVIRNPKYGYGSNMNPCIDCRIYMLREAKRLAQNEGADFIVTGDVLGERPMSQNKAALKLEEKEAELSELILRPLSAQLLPETVPERQGWVDRGRLLSIAGKNRKPQLALAHRLGITEYLPPSGGCLLTNKEFSEKLSSLFKHKKHITKRDIELLKLGRHFSLPSSRIIVGRNKEENRLLLELKNREDYLFEVTQCPSPLTILEGHKDQEAIEFAARLTAKYSDASSKQVPVEYRSNGQRKTIIVDP